MTSVRTVATPEGQALPYIFYKPHSVGRVMVPQAMLYPSRDMLADAIRAVPRGSTSSLIEIRAQLARQHGTETTCPVTTVRMVAEIADDAVINWSSTGDVVPVWRVIDADRPSARQFAGGPDFFRARREAEQEEETSSAGE